MTVSELIALLQQAEELQVEVRVRVYENTNLAEPLLAQCAVVDAKEERGIVVIRAEQV